MHFTGFIRTRQQNVIDENYGKQPCSAKTLCLFKEQPYPAAALCYRVFMSVGEQPYAAKTLCLDY